jgi:hypothetical protein
MAALSPHASHAPLSPHETHAPISDPRARSISMLPPCPFPAPSGPRQQYIQFLTKPKAYGQILKRLVLGERRNRFVPED